MCKWEKIGTRCMSAILTVVLLLGLVSCGKQEKAQQYDILTQKRSEGDRTQITIMVKYAFTINGFEKAVEEKFPNIDLVQVGNYAGGMGIKEYERRIEHDDLTDVIITWPLEVGEEYWEDRLIDLSGMDFTSRYNISMLNNTSRDGKLYYLPGPAQVRGIVYNKTMFEENGWEVPGDYEGFLALCKTIEDSGIRAIQLGFQDGEVLDTAFIGYNYSNYFSKPQDLEWMERFNRGEGSFGEHLGSALDVFQEMIDAGIWKEEDLSVNYSDREIMIYDRQCAMVEDSVLLARRGYEQAGSTDEFALMPFFNPGDDSEWARLYMVCYIGLNKHLEEKKNEKKYELVKEIMDYISTPEGQEALASDTGGMFSSVTQAPPPDSPELKEMLPALNKGHYAVFPNFKNCQDVLREGLAGMVRGDLTAKQVIEMIDAGKGNSPSVKAPEKLGTAKENFSLMETGNFVTDVMREYSGCEIALFLDNGKDGRFNGKGISGNLYKGDISSDDITCILPDLKSGDSGSLWKIGMKGADLIQTLEYAIPVENNNTGWFYYFSGLRMEYDPMEKPGKRIHNLTIQDNKKIEQDEIYSVAITEGSVAEKYFQSCENTGVLMQEILEDAVKEKGTITPAEDGRFTLPGK